MHEFDEGERESLPRTSAVSDALGPKVLREFGQEVHSDGVREFLPVGTADAASEELIRLAHVAHDDRHAERLKGGEGRAAECDVGACSSTRDAENDGFRAEALHGALDEAGEGLGRTSSYPRRVPAVGNEAETVEGALTGTTGMKLEGKDTRRRRERVAHSDGASRALTTRRHALQGGGPPVFGAWE